MFSNRSSSTFFYPSRESTLFLPVSAVCFKEDSSSVWVIYPLTNQSHGQEDGILWVVILGVVGVGTNVPESRGMREQWISRRAAVLLPEEQRMDAWRGWGEPYNHSRMFYPHQGGYILQIPVISCPEVFCVLELSISCPGMTLED